MAKKGKNRKSSAGRIPTVVEANKPAPDPSQLSRRGGRETADALIVAFVLAFLIRTFQAEAFVIPTGSMAPTLMGQHKDVFCDQCGTRFKVNSSDETERAAPVLRQAVSNGRMTAQEAQQQLQGMTCVGGQCPQCRRIMLLEDRGTESFRSNQYPTASQTANYSGDRLVVSKFAYSFSDPQRWDVAVFKYPGNSQTNYIKRVTGLPGEELRIFQGDLFVRPLDRPNAEFEIASKPAKQVLAMQQFVHDTDREPQSLIDAGWPLPWSSKEGWTTEKKSSTSTYGAKVYETTFQGKAPSGETRWLRYRHLPPGENVWRRILQDGEAVTVEPSPQLITDFTPYNTRLRLGQALALGQLSLAPRRGRSEDLGLLGLHWVGDLILEANLSVQSDSGRVSLDLVEAGDHYGVTVDIASGDLRVWRQPFESNTQQELGSASCSIKGTVNHRLRLANVDNQLLVWVDGQLVLVQPYTTEESDAEGLAQIPRSSTNDSGDLAPAGVGIEGAKVRVDRLRLWRDGYYLAASSDTPRSNFTTDLPRRAFEEPARRDYAVSMIRLQQSPELWPALANRRKVDFKIAEGQLFMMGDNSGFSLDARLWAGGNQGEPGKPGGPYLERDQLVGKAICVYWPHAWYSVPFTKRMVPAWPNFEDMRLVR